MMSKQPVLSARELVRALEKAGYAVDHQTGSHLILRQREPPHRRLTIPNHPEIAKGTLRSILRQAGMSVDQLREHL
jgi:predicted RNA binding protein YcfA (HicA-like mRNA interferase family)